MKKYELFVGIDVSKSKLDVSFVNSTNSKDIAFYAISHQYKLKLGSLPDEALHKIKLLYSEREKLVKAIQMFERTTENIVFCLRSC